MPSRPFTEEIPAEPQAELLAHGFTSKSVAPADPALSSFPANIALEDMTAITQIDILNVLRVIYCLL